MAGAQAAPLRARDGVSQRSIPTVGRERVGFFGNNLKRLLERRVRHPRA